MNIVVLVGVFVMISSINTKAYGVNSIGFFFDELATQSCITVEPEGSYGLFDAYLILLNPTFNSIEVLAFSMPLEGPIARLGHTFSGNNEECDLPPLGSFCAIWQDPFPLGTLTVLGVFSCLVFEFGEPGFIYLGDYGNPGAPPGAKTGEGEILQLNPVCGVGAPVAQINGECGIVAENEMSWGELKCLFR